MRNRWVILRVGVGVLMASSCVGWAVAVQPPVVAVAPEGDAAVVRREIEATLDEIVQVVLAGDGAGYLAHVVGANAGGAGGAADDGLAGARFRKEQENWAADLKDHKPLEFELSIDEPDGDAGAGEGGTVFGAERAAFRLRMVYRMDTGAAKRRTRASWPAVFVKAAGGGGEKGRWLYAGEDWRTLSGDGFVVKYFAGSEKVADEVLKAFPKAKAHDDEGFEIENHSPQTIKLYSNMEHLKATVYLSMPDRVLGGWNEPGESIKFMANYTRGVPGWTGAFAHEYGHVATWELGPKANDMPWWVQEGAAELAAAPLVKDYPERTDAMIRGLAARGRLARWEEICDYRTAAAPLKHLAYHQGYHLIAYISERWERAGRNGWLRRMAAGETLDEATRHQFGMSFEELDAAWRAGLENTGEAPGTKGTRDSKGATMPGEAPAPRP